MANNDTLVDELVDTSWITDDMFDRKLRELCARPDVATVDGTIAYLLAIPGVYEAVREELNNDVLRELEGEREDTD